MGIKPSNRLAGVGTYYFAEKLRQIDRMRRAGRHIINLGIGSPDLPPHPDVIRVLSEAASRPMNHGYQSYRGIPELREAFAEWYAREYAFRPDPERELLPLMGSKEGIMHLSMALLDPGDVVLVPNPGYPGYAAAAKLAGAEVRHYELSAERGWQPDIAAIEAQDLSGVKMLWLNYPHMPTGTPGNPDTFAELIAFARRRNILLCHDNPYNGLLNPRAISLIAQPGAMDVAVELNSLSKTYNMAGWRLGVMLGNEEMVNTVLRFKSNMDSGMFKPVQLAGARALGLDAGWMEELNKTYTMRQKLALQVLEALDCRVDGAQVGLFLWAEVAPEWPNAESLSEELLMQAGLFITPGFIFGSAGDRYLRISLCSPTEDLEQALEQCKSFKHLGS